MTTIYEQLATSVLSNTTTVKTMHKKVDAIGLITAQSRKVLDNVQSNINDSDTKLETVLTHQSELQDKVVQLTGSVTTVQETVEEVHEELHNVAENVTTYVENSNTQHESVLIVLDTVIDNANTNNNQLLNEFNELRNSLNDVNYSEKLGELGNVLTTLTDKLDQLMTSATESFERRDRQMDYVEQTALETNNTVTSFKQTLSLFEDRITTLSDQINGFDEKLEKTTTEIEERESIEDLTDYFLSQADVTDMPNTVEDRVEESSDDATTENNTNQDGEDNPTQDEANANQENVTIVASSTNRKKGRFWGFGKKD